MSTLRTFLITLHTYFAVRVPLLRPKVVREIISVVVATDNDDHTFEEASGLFAARFDALREVLSSPESGTGADAVLSRVGDL